MTPRSDSFAPDADELDSALLERYWLGETSPDETASVDAWFSEHPECDVRYARLQRRLTQDMWSDFSSDGVERIVAGTLDAIGVRRQDGVLGAPRETKMTAPPAKRAVWERLFETQALRRWASAAFALAVLGVAVVGLMNRTATRGDRVAVTASGARYATAMGQRAVVRLTDGSRVTLAPQTTLQLDAAFGSTSRGMSLSGEAYFEVAAGARAPFVVRTGAVTTRVLGTAFTVRRYPGDASARVAVVSGKVGVSANTPRRPTVTLSAGGVGVVTDTSATATGVGSAAPFPTWVEGQLVFHEAPVPEVLTALTRWYGYRFRLTDSALARKKLTVWISTESSREALATLRLTMGVDLTFEGMLVTLSPRRATKDAAPRSRDPQHIISPLSREVGR